LGSLKAVRVVMADDHQIWRAGVRSDLGENFEAVGEAADGTEAVQHVARGHTYREIGEERFIAEKTVENHVRNILAKLHLNRKNELMRYAIEHGID